MIKYHAVMLDETRCEFGVSVEAEDRAAAYQQLRDNYPESRCVQLEDAFDTARREAAIYDRIARELDGDDHYYDMEDYEDD